MSQARDVTAYVIVMSALLASALTSPDVRDGSNGDDGKSLSATPFARGRFQGPPVPRLDRQMASPASLVVRLPSSSNSDRDNNKSSRFGSPAAGVAVASRTPNDNAPVTELYPVDSAATSNMRSDLSTEIRRARER
jgi:hypothetical protein